MAFERKQVISMHDTVRIQVQYLSDGGIPLGDWRDMTFVSNPTQQMIYNHMLAAKKSWPRARVRAVNKQGQLLDMLSS